MIQVFMPIDRAKLIPNDDGDGAVIEVHLEGGKPYN